MKKGFHAEHHCAALAKRQIVIHARKGKRLSTGFYFHFQICA